MSSPSAAVTPMPEEYPGVVPYLVVEDPAAALDFYARAFQAEEVVRLKGPDGVVVHAEMRIGKAPFMLSGEWPDMGFRGPKHYGGSPVSLFVYVPDVDAFAAHAEQAGAQLLRPIENKFYGDRMASFADPFGLKWDFASRFEIVTPEEMERRMAAMG